MNAIFPVIIILSISVLTFTSPQTTLTAFTSATEKAVELSFTLIGVYAVWQGVSYLLEKSGINKKIAKVMKKPVQKLFNTSSDETVYQLSLNLTSNALGLSGVSTPAGIESMRLLDSENNEHGKTLLTVISSTSIQILPVSVVQLLANYGQNPSLIIIVSLLSTAVSTAIGILFCKVLK